MTSARTRLVAVFAHPDDESFAVGGTLALTAASGASVEVVTATRGEGLAGDRSAELAAACATLGAAPPTVLDLPDGRLPEVEAELERALSEILAARAPSVVLTFAPDGAYGHRDHLAVTRAVGAVASRPASGVERVLHVVFPRGLMRPVRRRLRRVRGIVEASVKALDLGVEPVAIDLAVDIRPVAALKRAAVACHRSQLAAGDADSFLVPGLLPALLVEEWFVLARGVRLPAAARGPLDGLPPPPSG